jgi:hypothetical protein
MTRGVRWFRVVAVAAVASAVPGYRTADGQARTTIDRESVDALFSRLGRARDDTAFASATRALLARLPSHPTALLLAAQARARTGDPAGALALLERLAALGDTRSIDGIDDFKSLRTSPRFRRVTERLAENRRPVSAGETVLTLTDVDFIPESVMFDSVSGDFYVGSLSRRMLVRLRRDASGAVRADTIAGPADGLLRVVGIELDRPRDRLWFATWAPGSDTATSTGRRVIHTRLFAYDRTRRTLRRYDVADSLRPHLLNDLVVTASGDVYITDTAEGTVWRLLTGTGVLERVTRPHPAQFHAANGITMSPGGRRLYVAFTAGIAEIDPRTGSARYLEVPPDVTTAGVDGLYWHRGTLVAIQGLGTDERVVRFTLDPAGTRVIGARVLERGAPVFKRPTTGTLVGDDLYYIPDAQYDRLGWDGSLSPATDATPSTIRRLPLLARSARAP